MITSSISVFFSVITLRLSENQGKLPLMFKFLVKNRVSMLSNGSDMEKEKIDWKILSRRLDYILFFIFCIIFIIIMIYVFQFSKNSSNSCPKILWNGDF